jgi:NADPH-dependent F420 reductase
MDDSSTVAVIGGTGSLGAAIARRLAKAGRKVILGSRAAEAAQDKAAELGFGLLGMTNAEAAAAGDIIVVAVPFAAQEPILAEIRPHAAGKIVIDTTVPLRPPKVMRAQMPAEGCAARRAQDLLGPGVTVVSAFHNVAAHKLITDEDVICDVLVFGDDKAVRGVAARLVEDCGLRAWHGGPLVNSVAAEALTSVLIFINKTYDIDGAGITIGGNPGPAGMSIARSPSA